MFLLFSAAVEASDQILAKYRRSANNANQNDLTANFQSRNETSGSVDKLIDIENDDDDMRNENQLQLSVSHMEEVQRSANNVIQHEPSTEEPYYDPSDVTRCRAFIDAKRKLRMVLSSINVGTLAIVGMGLSSQK